MRKQKIAITLILLITGVFLISLCACGNSNDSGESYEDYEGYEEGEYDPSEFYQYDISGTYYSPHEKKDGTVIQAGEEQLEARIEAVRDGTGLIVGSSSFEIRDNESGYVTWAVGGTEAVSVDCDRETHKMRLVAYDGDIEREGVWEYSEELEEWYFIDDFGDEYFFKMTVDD